MDINITNPIQETLEISFPDSPGSAASGTRDYNELKNKPKINGQTLEGDTTLPTKTSELLNDSDFVSDSNYVHTDNNFTDNDKKKLSDIESGAQENVIEIVKVNGTVLNPDEDKAVNIDVPTKTSDITNDSGFVKDAQYVHTDNNFSDNLKMTYDDTVETVKGLVVSGGEPNVIEAVKVNGTALTPDTNKAVDVTVPTKTSDITNDSGFINKSVDNLDNYTKSSNLADIATEGMKILSYGNSTWNDFIRAYKNNEIVYCRASSSSNPASGSQTRLAFMAYVNNAANPTEVEFQYYRSISSHSSSQQTDQVFVYKLNSSGAWTVTIRESGTKVVAGEALQSNYSNGAITLNVKDEFLELLDKTLKYNGEVPTDWNDARTFGVYHVSGSGYQNAIATGGIYGILLVYESTGGTWAPEPNGNSWIWQEFRDTAGGIYKRYAVNDANGWSAWDDTGWVNATVNSPASPINWNPLQYRRKGDTVFIRGGVTYGQTPSWETQIGSIPAEFAPRTEADFACRGTGTDGITVIAITANGEINYLTNSNNYPGDGLLISASYLID